MKRVSRDNTLEQSLIRPEMFPPLLLEQRDGAQKDDPR